MISLKLQLTINSGKTNEVLNWYITEVRDVKTVFSTSSLWNVTSTEINLCGLQKLHYNTQLRDVVSWFISGHRKQKRLFGVISQPWTRKGPRIVFMSEDMLPQGSLSVYFPSASSISSGWCRLKMHQLTDVTV